jgi:hypothetical protein
MRPWRLDLEAIDVPVVVLFGADDACTGRTRRDAGGLLFAGAWWEVFW